MAHPVKIPPAGESINSATVGQWHKSDGESVQKGEILATIDTDKVSTELEAEVAGVLHILAQEGAEVAIGAVIAEIAEGAPAAPDEEASPTPTPTPLAQSAPEPAPAPPPGPASELSPEPQGAAVAEPAPPTAPAPAPAAEGEGEVIEIKVPAAGESISSATIAQWHKRGGEAVREGETLVTLETDKVSAELDAEADGILTILSAEGSEVGIGAVIGSIRVGAVPAAASAPPPDPAPAAQPAPAAAAAAETMRAAAPAPADPPAPAPTAAPQRPTRLVPDLTVARGPARESAAAPVSDGRTTRTRMSPLRRKIATQLVHAQHTAAILTTFNEIDMTAVMKLRKSVQESFIEKYEVKLGFMSLFAKAVVRALKEVPSVNGRVDGEEIVQNHFYDIGIAVGTEKGLVVPVLRDVDKKGCAQLERDILDYATRAREGKIKLEDLQGGTFTISNGGIYGSLLSTPILNPPQSGILGMHTIQERPIALEGRVEIRPMMYVALSYDHRLVDGKEAVTFLIHVKDSLESPVALLLEL